MIVSPNYFFGVYDADESTFDVVGCRYAVVFHQLGEPDLGFLLVCSDDLVASPR